MFYFIILNRNGKHFLLDCLPTLFSQTHKKTKIIIIDTRSTDGSIEYIKSLKNKNLDLIIEEKERGYAYKNNLGIKIALKDNTCTHICLLNNDTKINPKFCEEIIKASNKFKKAGIFSPKYLYMGTNKIQVAGGGNFSSEVLTGEKQIGHDEMDHGQYDKYAEIDFGYGAGWVILPEAFNKVGLLDPNWVFGFEEPDFCKRAKRFGYKTMYIPKAIVEHAVGGSAKAKKNASVLLTIKLVYARNYFRFLIKHYPFPKALRFEAKKVLKAIKKINRPHILILEVYSTLWNLIHLSKTLHLKKMEREEYD